MSKLLSGVFIALSFLMAIAPISAQAKGSMLDPNGSPLKDAMHPDGITAGNDSDPDGSPLKDAIHPDGIMTGGESDPDGTP